MNKYLIQAGGIMQKERRCLLNAELINSSFESLPDNKGMFIPIGSVEFVNEYSRLNDILIPQNISYPVSLLPFLKRKIWKDEYKNVDDDLFVKPVNTKIFTGAIKRNLPEHVKDNEQVWVSDPIEFTAEFRFYILKEKILGYSRYDDGEDEITPSHNIVELMIKAYKTQPIGYAIDVVVVNGETILIEVNDGWSLGYYPWGNCSQSDYVELITERWKEIVKKSDELKELHLSCA